MGREVFFLAGMSFGGGVVLLAPAQGLYGNPRITPSCVTLLFHHKELTDDSAVVADVLWLHMVTGWCDAMGGSWLSQAVPYGGHARCGLAAAAVRLSLCGGAPTSPTSARVPLSVHMPISCGWPIAVLAASPPQVSMWL